MFRVSTLSTLLALMLAAAPAAAQPTPAPDRCTVELVQVPDDIRPVVEEWVAAEPVCVVTLSVRVVPSEGGFYVLASDDTGRVYERMVPDGLTAAVLIASWVADDGGGRPAPAPSPTPEATPEPAPAPTPTPAPAEPTPALAPTPAPSPAPTPAPSAAPGAMPIGPYEVREAGRTAPALRGRAFSFGVLVGEVSAGIRADLDWRKYRGITLGVAVAAIRTDESSVVSGGAQGREALALIEASYDKRYGRLGLRLGLGLGVAFSNVYVQRYDGGTFMTGEFSAVSPTADASVIAAFSLGRWSLRGGVIASRMADLEGDGVEWHRPEVDLHGYAGVSRAW